MGIWTNRSTGEMSSQSWHGSKKKWPNQYPKPVWWRSGGGCGSHCGFFRPLKKWIWLITLHALGMCCSICEKMTQKLGGQIHRYSWRYVCCFFTWVVETTTCCFNTPLEHSSNIRVLDEIPGYSVHIQRIRGSVLEKQGVLKSWHFGIFTFSWDREVAFRQSISFQFCRFNSEISSNFFFWLKLRSHGLWKTPENIDPFFAVNSSFKFLEVKYSFQTRMVSGFSPIYKFANTVEDILGVSHFDCSLVWPPSLSSVWSYPCRSSVAAKQKSSRSEGDVTSARKGHRIHVWYIYLHSP